MHIFKTLAVFALTLLLSACAENTPVKEKPKNPSGFDSAQLAGEWWLNTNLSNNDQQWSREKPSGLRRFYSRMSFQLPNQFGTTVLHPTDRHYAVNGTFTVQGNIVNTEYRLSSGANESVERRNRLVQKRFIVLRINDQDMVIRLVPTTTETTSNAIEKSRLVGSWRAGKKFFDSNNSGHYLLTPCAQNSSANPCHLVLEANGNALIRVNVPKTLTAVPDNSPQKFSVQAGIWVLNPMNRLVVRTNQAPKQEAILELSAKGEALDSRVNYSTLYW